MMAVNELCITMRYDQGVIRMPQGGHQPCARTRKVVRRIHVGKRKMGTLYRGKSKLPDK